MGKFRIVVTLLLVLITVLLSLIYSEMRHSNKVQDGIHEYLYNAD